MKTRIITLLLAILTIVIGGAYAQTKIKVHKGGEVIYSVPLTDVDSVGFAKVTSSVHNGHEFVDLGLPSGTKWATCNVGATTPEGFGNYYAWAETEPNTIYDWTTYKYCDGIGSRITKYATGYSYSQDPDGLTDLEMSDDVARVDWGGSWRIPTEEEMTELINNCNWTWVTQNGISGYKVTSTVNGNSIFLPATGAKGDGYVSNQEYAYYWTNSIRDYVNNSANALYYINAYPPSSTGNLTRCSGASVRAVCNIDGGNTQTKVSIFKEDDVIYSKPIAEIDSIKFEREYNGISTEKYYRIKNVERDLYLNAVNYDFHFTGSFGGVNCTAYAQDADQIFKFEVSGDKFKVITNSGYYLYCQKWIVDAQTAGVDLSFVKNDDETYDIMFGESYFAVDEVNGYYYPFCNATEGEKATWVLEEATPLPTYTVSVSATEGGTASTSVNSMAQGGSATLFATPESGYRFVNWTVNGSEVSTENIFVATITANTEFVANFEERTTDSGISLTKEYRIKHVESGNYLNVSNNFTHVGGTNGGVNCVAYAENNNQIFVFEASGTNYYLKSKSGYYIYCQQWNVDALTTGTELTFIDNPDGTYYIKNGANYFKVEDVNGVYYPFCDAPADLRATWVLEQVGGEETEPIPTYTVSVSATQGGTVTTSAESVEEGGSVILTATPETGYRFVNWTLNNNVVSVSNPFIATITANSEFVANFEAEENQSGELHNGHEYVDLGLPSGLKWATCNVGATAPEEYGNNYAWGETTPQSWLATEYTYNDNPEVLPLSADAANVNWGGNWRMPTYEELSELMDTNNCTWEWTTQNGVNGYRVTSKINGNSIFLPGAANSGYYWSSSAYPGSTLYAYCLMFTSVSVNCDYSQRNYGQSVRAVFGEKQTFTVSVSSTIGGTASASAESVEQGGSVTLTATANSGYEFVNWTLGGEVVSTENPYTVTVNANSEFVANFEAEENQSGELHNGHEYIDLGLPSGLKWATCNVGATTPEEYGDYFAWGETETKEVYYRDTYTYTSTPTRLPLSADAANVNWGGKWRMPTGDEMEELMDTNNCTWEWTTQNGVNGYKVTSKKNGNSIFLPAAGERQNYNLTNEGSDGYYWSSSLDTSMSERAHYLDFADYGNHLGSLFCYLGMPVRAVYEASYIEPTMCTVSVSSTSGGKATASASSVEQGGTVTLTATANSFCEFVNWTLNGEVVSTENPYTITVTENCEYVANFVEFETACLWYYISDDYSGSGDIEATLTSTGETLSSGRDFLAGSEVTLTATPYSDEDVFIRWELHKPNDEIIVITENPCTITVTENSYIDAVFYSNPVSLSIVAEGGTITGGETLIELYDSVDLTATPNDGYAFENWTIDGEVVSTQKNYSFMILEDMEIKANFIEYKKTGTHNNHDYIDLGLPSGTKWATYSVGATIPDENGYYFAWGETEPKDTYEFENYKYNGGEGYDGGVYKYFYSKYNDDDDIYELESIDDAARVNWGDGWRMPTSDEMKELCNTDNCIWTSTIINEVRVYKVTSKTNGNYIFFPYIEGKSVIDENGRLTCAFWSKDRRSTYGETVVMYSDGGTSTWARYRGTQVRAVCTKGKEDVTPLPTYTVSTSATEGGTVTSSASSVEQGGSVTLTATPISGYVFKNWTLGGVVVSTENPYTATVTANSEFVANFEEEVSDSGISLTKGYRIKHVESGMYLNVENIDEHTGGTNGGVNCVAYAISNNQIFSFEAVGSNFYLKSKSGYYIYCQDWNVDALSQKTALTFTENEDGTYYILNGSKYFKVEQVNGTYYPFGDAPADLRATWVLEEAIETPPTTAVYNGHEYIDLGLPSGIKWATCNVGATTPAEYGDYFAWGETEPKDFYNWNTYKHCVENGDYYSVNSYCPNSDIGVEDNRTILDAEDDAASANWGGTWRMPTKKEQEELLNNCIWEWTSQNGKFGYKIISKINGNSIFLPAAGFFLDGNANLGNCNYWSSSVKINHNSSAACLINGESYYEYRNYGQSVRAVFGENNEVGTICSVSASATEGGSATASASSVEGGGSVTLTATPDEGYVFKNWTLGGEVVSTENPYTATVTANSEYVANFEEIVKYNVTASVNNSDMGSATASASSVEQGESVTLTATANSGYLFKNWTLGGEVVSTENPYTATITANSEFVANFEEIVVSGAAISLTQYFRIKDINSGKYLNADNYEAHTSGTNGGVNCIDYADSDDQKFMFEASDTNFSLKTKSGYYIYCQAWNVDALTSGTVLTFEENGNGAYYIKTSDGYFKVEQVNGTYYPFCGASSSKKATWILEETGEATNQVIPTFTVEAKANTGGSAKTSATTVAYGESVTLTATPNTEYGYIFNYWSKTGKGQVSTENPYSPIITANSQFYANFKKAVYTISVSATEGGTATTSAESVEHGTYITLTATPDEGYVFKCWTVNGEIVSVKSSYGTTANANSEFVANFIKYADGVTGSENGHDYVDLGLPSGTRWATCNVGATTPEEKGNYYSWGETETKESYTLGTYKYYGGDVPTKYALDPADSGFDDEQFIDKKIALEASDDAATVNWGGKWRMPTKAEAKELVDYCTWTSWTQNGVSGYKVTSNINGNSIFLPKAGGYVGTDGAFYSNGWYYWTSSLDIDDNEYAYYMKGNAITTYDRYRGQTIRAVCPANGEGAPTITVGVSSSSGGKASVSSNSVAKNGTVFLTATPNNGYAFKNWTLDGEVVSTESTYTATVTANSSSYRHYVANFEDVSGKVHEYVDLGLSVKWATYNVGATDIYDKGDIFAWGETEVKNYYKWGTYKYATGSWSYLKTITKYSTSRVGTYGPADGKDTLEPEDDAATVNWGGNWRMPTKYELIELYENCTWVRTVKNGIYVMEGTSKINGNTICFILGTTSQTMSLWSSSLGDNVTANGNDHENARNAVSLYFGNGVNPATGMYYDKDRSNGFYVRAVCE